MAPSRIVILEKDPQRRDYLRFILSERGHLAFTFEKDTVCLENLQPLKPDLVLAGPLPAARARRFIHTVKMINRQIAVVMLSADPTLQDFINANGFSAMMVASDEFEPSRIRTVVSRMLDRRPEKRRPTAPAIPLIVGNSPAMLEIKKKIIELGSLKETVLIQGEPGTGKERVARAIHAGSERRERPFVKVDLAQIDSGQIDELFFQPDPAPQGWQAQNPNRILEAAGEGTVFLKSIEATPVSRQGALLALFTNGHGPRSNRPDVRFIVSGSNNLRLLVARGGFRKDLYFRLNTVCLDLPPLRDRRGDILLLADFFADKFRLELGRGSWEFSPKTMELFDHYNWPGNVRELEHLVRHAVATGNEESLYTNLWARHASRGDREPSWHPNDSCRMVAMEDLEKALNGSGHVPLKDLCRKYAAQTEKKIIPRALEHTGGNRKKAAALLGISYKSLLMKIKEYGLG